MSDAQSSAATAAFLSTGLISLAPNALLLIFPNYSALASTECNLIGNGSHGSSRVWLSLGQALAVGGLMGDVFLHTLPDCLEDSKGTSGEEVGIRVILGFGTFFILDVLVRSLEHTHSNDGIHDDSHLTTNGKSDHLKISIPKWKLLLRSSVLLNLIGDALHNFTDGLAIGATFAASHSSFHTPFSSSSSHFFGLKSALSVLKSRGGLASVSVFLHEIPHELGDFATLVNAGLSRNMAIGAQFVTAISAFMGTAFGLYSSKFIEGLEHDVLLAFTAGGFIYLSCVTILPDILETNSGAFMRLLQICSVVIGVAFMYMVIVLEEMEEKMGNVQVDTHNYEEL